MRFLVLWLIFITLYSPLFGQWASLPLSGPYSNAVSYALTLRDIQKAIQERGDARDMHYITTYYTYKVDPGGTIYTNSVQVIWHGDYGYVHERIVTTYRAYGTTNCDFITKIPSPIKTITKTMVPSAESVPIMFEGYKIGSVPIAKGYVTNEIFAAITPYPSYAHVVTGYAGEVWMAHPVKLWRKYGSIKPDLKPTGCRIPYIAYRTNITTNIVYYVDPTNVPLSITNINYWPPINRYTNYTYTIYAQFLTYTQHVAYNTWGVWTNYWEEEYEEYPTEKSDLRWWVAYLRGEIGKLLPYYLDLSYLNTNDINGSLEDQLNTFGKFKTINSISNLFKLTEYKSGITITSKTDSAYINIWVDDYVPCSTQRWVRIVNIPIIISNSYFMGFTNVLWYYDSNDKFCIYRTNNVIARDDTPDMSYLPSHVRQYINWSQYANALIALNKKFVRDYKPLEAYPFSIRTLLSLYYRLSSTPGKGARYGTVDTESGSWFYWFYQFYPFYRYYPYGLRLASHCYIWSAPTDFGYNIMTWNDSPAMVDYYRDLWRSIEWKWYSTPIDVKITTGHVLNTVTNLFIDYQIYSDGLSAAIINNVPVIYDKTNLIRGVTDQYLFGSEYDSIPLQVAYGASSSSKPWRVSYDTVKMAGDKPILIHTNYTFPVSSYTGACVGSYVDFSLVFTNVTRFNTVTYKTLNALYYAIKQLQYYIPRRTPYKYTVYKGSWGAVNGPITGEVKIVWNQGGGNVIYTNKIYTRYVAATGTNDFVQLSSTSVRTNTDLPVWVHNIDTTYYAIPQHYFVNYGGNVSPFVLFTSSLEPHYLYRGNRNLAFIGNVNSREDLMYMHNYSAYVKIFNVNYTPYKWLCTNSLMHYSDRTVFTYPDEWPYKYYDVAYGAFLITNMLHTQYRFYIPRKHITDDSRLYYIDNAQIDCVSNYVPYIDASSLFDHTRVPGWLEHEECLWFYLGWYRREMGTNASIAITYDNTLESKGMTVGSWKGTPPATIFVDKTTNIGVIVGSGLYTTSVDLAIFDGGGDPNDYFLITDTHDETITINNPFTNLTTYSYHLEDVVATNEIHREIGSAGTENYTMEYLKTYFWYSLDDRKEVRTSNFKYK